MIRRILLVWSGVAFFLFIALTVYDVKRSELVAMDTIKTRDAFAMSRLDHTAADRMRQHLLAYFSLAGAALGLFGTAFAFSGGGGIRTRERYDAAQKDDAARRVLHPANEATRQASREFVGAPVAISTSPSGDTRPLVRHRCVVDPKLKAPLRWLSVFFVVATGTLAFRFLTIGVTGSVGTIAALLSLVGVVSAWSFLFQLGRLAKRLGRSWIVWVGASLLTAPIGPLVAYFRMRNLICRPTAGA